MAGPSPKFDRALAAIDAANAADPNRVTAGGREAPKELVYAEQMTRWLAALAPDASEMLRLAVRAQHIRRWEIPRDRYPMDRIGYLTWRTDLKHLHAKLAGDILQKAGYDAATIARVQALVKKERLKQDVEAQTLEDVACLVFLENYFADFAKEHEPDKVVEILRKTWKKMSPRGRDAALNLEMPAAARALVEKALAEPAP
jgi:Domain of unknown function (DUF4202)